VEFLTDNTLGRIWYEMTKGETALKDTCCYLVRRPTEIFLDEGEEAPEQSETDENLSQEELLRQPVYIPHRPLKDPREIKMLDPACGSMHFGLYAFDLFEHIYSEAWELEEHLGEDALLRLADLDSLHKTYPDNETYLKDVPRLIIEHNIHGVDIDPRAVQIAGLSLWLRAQKSWQTQGLKPHGRPQIRKSNVVCAEPMPGDRQMLDEFLSTLRGDGLEALMRKAWHVPADQKVRATPQMADALAKLVRTVWQEMELAGEAGSLLKIEETLREAIATARKEAEEKSPLFRVLEYGLGETPKAKYVKVIAGEDQDFFDRSEELVLVALNVYSEQAENGVGFKRRLFVGDASKGFSFIDLLRKNFDVMLMNPPFGTATESSTKWIKEKYENTYSNLGATFVERSSNLLNNNGGLGIIIDISTSIRSSYENYRKSVLYSKYALTTYMPLGWDVLDANVEVCCFTAFSRIHDIETVFCLDASANKDKQSKLATATNSIKNGQNDSDYYLKSQRDFISFPNGVPSFSIPNTILHLFSKARKLDPDFANVRTGLSTGDNERFYKLYWEIKPGNNWFYLSNGGVFSPFFRPSQEVINWGHNGREITEYKDASGKLISRPQNLSFSKKPGLSYGKRGEYLSVHAHPKDRYFTNEGQGIFPHNSDFYFFLLAYINSKLLRTILNEYCGQHKENGYVSLLPILFSDESAKEELGNYAKSVIFELRKVQRFRLEHVETVPPSINGFATLHEYIDATMKNLEVLKLKLALLEDEINSLVFSNLGVDEEGKRWVETKSKSMPPFFAAINAFSWEPREIVSEIVDYLLGFLFGRWNYEFFIGVKNPPEMANPFDSLPQYPTGMLSPDEITKIQNGGKQYPINIIWSGIIDDSNINSNNIEGQIRKLLNLIWKANSDNIEQEMCGFLKVNSIREFINLPSQFFTDHLNRYSKGRRSAPIYWPLSTPSCSYTLWLYYHRLNNQTLYTCVNDFVDPKLKQVSEEAARLRLKKSRSAADEKELERLTDFERELKDFREELLRVAKLWKPNLNDGVEITAAPLWKLFQQKPWQKRLKETWQKLEAGEYDWAHLAYSIWPERVREKCKNDKSLAIAHDLEELYVEPPASAKKKKAKKPAIDEETEGWFNDD